ncbi:MAG: DinB family protein [Candidatus Korobacteraceae bacterium]
MNDAALREQLSRLLAWEDAHVGFDTAVAGIPLEARGKRPPGLPHSPWEIVEHLRRTQRDILDFCVNPNYREIKWPDEYWPSDAAPGSAAAWEESIRQFREDRAALQQLAADTKTDLGAKIPHGSGQTYLRELVLVADHSSYHIGELVAVRRLLGVWKAA